jgi:predicted dehydrogenase
MKHKVLLLGLGFWGKNWLNLIQKTDRCELAGVAGSTTEIEHACTQNGVDRKITFTDYKEAIDKTDADIAVIVIPAVMHADAAKRAMAKGINVIMEKPLAVDINQAQELLDVKKANGK